MTIAAIVEEIGSLAEHAADLPIYFKSARTREGVEAMIQAAKAFRVATTEAERHDAALWIGEAYMIFSASLPDTGSNEQTTGWATAKDMSRLLGGPEVWAQRVRSEFSA